MLEKITKLIDLKSIVTLMLVTTLVYVVISGRPIDEKVFLLFSNIVTAVVTYFFAKKDSKVE
jgi:hypothetical protein